MVSGLAIVMFTPPSPPCDLARRGTLNCRHTGQAVGVAEAWWAVLGAIVLLVTGQLTTAEVGHAIGAGTDVYLFLIGMMLAAELARTTGLFDWIAAQAVRSARGSATKLFCLVYVVGIVVTTFMSNDATAVVLTPAVLVSAAQFFKVGVLVMPVALILCLLVL
jgi:Na+/H+ antiporter NhaD/arsenite permease-like protein